MPERSVLGDPDARPDAGGGRAQQGPRRRSAASASAGSRAAASAAAGADRHRHARAARAVQRAGGLEITLWASTPMLYNPTNIDIDKDGRIWVAEGVRYRTHFARQPEGDRIVVLQDTNGDGKADSKHTFVQETGLVAPLGVSVIDNKIVVSQPPDLIVYTDVDRNQRFDPAVDKREVLLTGFHGANHDHSLHSVTVGPDGKWIFNQRQHRGDVHRPVRQDLSHLWRVPRRPGWSLQGRAQQGGPCGQAQRRRARLCRRVHGADESRRDQRRDHRPQLSQQLRAVGHLVRRRLPERQRRSAGVPREPG